MKHELYLGIDPGLDGALAVVGSVTAVYSVPTKENYKTGKRELDLIAMRNLLKSLYGPPGEANRFCMIEKVHAMPHQGVTSMFSFGEGYGIWKGILTGLYIPFETITPQQWKKAMSVNRQKETSLNKARQMFPSLADQLKRKKDDGRAEALLIAEYCKRRNHENAISSEL